MKKIVIVHGWTQSLDKWSELVKGLKKAGKDVIQLRVPGLTEKTEKIWDLSSYCEWLDKELAKIGEKVTLLGHSNGGRIAIKYVLNNSEKVDKLILVNSAGIRRKEFPTRVKRIIFMVLAKIGKIVFPSKLLKKLLYKLARERNYHDADENMKKTMKNLISVDLENALKDISIPTLIIWGENDKITPVSDAYKMNKEIKNSNLLVIPGAGHLPFYTHTKETLGAILDFI